MADEVDQNQHQGGQINKDFPEDNSQYDVTFDDFLQTDKSSRYSSFKSNGNLLSIESVPTLKNSN